MPPALAPPRLELVMGGRAAVLRWAVEMVVPVRSATDACSSRPIINDELPRVLVRAPSWWLSPTQRSLPRPGGGRPRLRWTRAFDWAVSRREPFQGPWVSVELSTCS